MSNETNESPALGVAGVPASLIDHTANAALPSNVPADTEDPAALIGIGPSSPNQSPGGLVNEHDSDYKHLSEAHPSSWQEQNPRTSLAKKSHHGHEHHPEKPTDIGTIVEEAQTFLPNGYRDPPDGRERQDAADQNLDIDALQHTDSASTPLTRPSLRRESSSSTPVLAPESYRDSRARAFFTEDFFRWRDAQSFDSVASLEAEGLLHARRRGLELARERLGESGSGAGNALVPSDWEAIDSTSAPTADESRRNHESSQSASPESVLENQRQNAPSAEDNDRDPMQNVDEVEIALPRISDESPESAYPEYSDELSHDAMVQASIDNLPGRIRDGQDQYDSEFNEANAASPVPVTDLFADESLSALERIFIYCKSEMSFHRLYMARSLAHYLPDVDLCETAEYVLPLLNGLGTDGEESIRQAFAENLEQVLWFFWSTYPLKEVEEEGDGPMRHDVLEHRHIGPIELQGMGRRNRRQSVIVIGNREDAEPLKSTETDEMGLIQQGDIVASIDEASESARRSSQGILPSISEQIAEHDEEVKMSTEKEDDILVERPVLSISTFTPLLHALLLDQSPGVGAALHTAIVTLLDKLQSEEQEPLDSTSNNQSPDASHSHKPYSLTKQTKALLRDELIQGVILGLGQLVFQIQSLSEDGQFEAHASQDSLIEDDWSQSLDGRYLNQEAGGTSSPASSWEEGSTAPTSVSAWDEPMNPNTNKDPWRRHSILHGLEPGADPHTTFASPEDEEAAHGRMAMMSLVSAVANAGCLGVVREVEGRVISVSNYNADVVVRFLNEAERLTLDPVFIVRKEAAIAFGALAKIMSADLLAERMMVIFDKFVKDRNWHVRRSSCLMIPNITRRIPPAERASQVLRLVTDFMDDVSVQVRSAAYEILGEMIYLCRFSNGGVPENLLRSFLIAADPPAISEESSDTMTFNSPKEPSRLMQCAFSMPAVILALGSARWYYIRNLYRKLCRSQQMKVRKTLASSLVEIAKIIGPSRASEDLVEIFHAFLGDQDDIKAPVIATLAAFFASLAAADRTLEAERTLLPLWESTTNWRIREEIASQLSALLEILPRACGGILINILMSAMDDSIAAIRQAAIEASPQFMRWAEAQTNSEDLDEQAQAEFMRESILAMSRDSRFRSRVNFVKCCNALIASAYDKDNFLQNFLPSFESLASDKIADVRLAVARCVSALSRAPSYYSDPASRPALLTTLIKQLSEDSDRDVRSFVVDLAEE